MSPFKLGLKVKTRREFDLRPTGGPLIPKGTEGIILRRYQGAGNEVWIDFESIPYQSRVFSADLTPVS